MSGCWYVLILIALFAAMFTVRARLIARERRRYSLDRLADPEPLPHEAPLPRWAREAGPGQWDSPEPEDTTEKEQA